MLKDVEKFSTSAIISFQYSPEEIIIIFVSDQFLKHANVKSIKIK